MAYRHLHTLDKGLTGPLFYISLSTVPLRLVQLAAGTNTLALRINPEPGGGLRNQGDIRSEPGRQLFKPCPNHRCSDNLLLASLQEVQGGG